MKEIRGSIRCDIFCQVVDNYGDIGVCWRLARQLATEHGYQVRLWVDHLASFARLLPSLDPLLEVQHCGGVAIHRWTVPFPPVAAADLVIEGFACQLPEAYLQAMAARARAPAWINLDYLSAETWVDRHHGLPSPHPRLPLTKHFFFPGFSPGSGGLLREAGLLQRRRLWRSDWAELGLAAPAAGETCLSLFCYANPALPELLQVWSEGIDPIRCLLAPGPAQAQAASWLDQALPAPGQVRRRGSLCLVTLPFYEQDRYDHLLWACDLNFVRGEDSFVRAQWAAQPLLWQAYPQPEDSHLAKLDAFLERYGAGLAPAAAAAYGTISRAWNGGKIQQPLAAAWRALLAQSPVLREHARAWAQQLGESEDLATRLVKLVEPLI